MRHKPVIIPTQGQLPIYGGITGPILSPCKIDIDTIRDLVAMRIDVDEVMLTEDGQYRLDAQNKLVTVRLDLNNYDKVNTVPVEEQPKYNVSSPSVVSENASYEVTTPQVEEPVEEVETNTVSEENEVTETKETETNNQQNQRKKNKQKK